jgi:hypothetical protein
VNPQFPLYVVSKGRADSRLTSRTLEAMRVPYRIVVEPQEVEAYAAHVDRSKILPLDLTYKDRYDTFDDLGTGKSTGPGPARNFVWDHAVAEGHAWHWVMDDNIRYFYRLQRNLKVPCADGTPFRAMEDFCLRYRNVAMAGPNYHMFAPRKTGMPPFALNTRIYSCNLIRCDAPFRWRGRYNEDTDLSLRMLKAGWATVQFYAFLQGKVGTQTVRGGNTEEFYRHEGTLAKSRMQVAMHPDVSELVWKFGRWHHRVHYQRFHGNPLVPREDLPPPSAVDPYGLTLRETAGVDELRARFRASGPPRPAAKSAPSGS